jgi:para-nitrobenzyl esterase
MINSPAMKPKSPAGKDIHMSSAIRCLAIVGVLLSVISIRMFSKLDPFAADVILADMDPKTVGAYHTADVPYWLQSFDAYNRFRVTRNWGRADKDLSDKMGDLLIAFASTGKPSTTAVQWPAWTPNKEQLVEFGDTIRILPMDTMRLNFHTTGTATRATLRLPRD